MSFNAFEQLEWVVPEPRQAFEDVTAEMLTSTERARRRIKISRGDGGVDFYCGTFGENGAAEVYQSKYFPRPPWTSSQKQQIRDSYQAARTCKEFNLSTWHLCVPSRPTKEDVRWFDEWARSLEVSATLIDGDDLIRILSEPNCARARKLLLDWGIVGIEDEGAVLEAVLKISLANEDSSGLSHIFSIILRNIGGRSADDVRVSITHSETGCVTWRADDHIWADIGQGSVNPWRLAARTSIHPGESVLALSIPIVRRTPFPFTIESKTWIRDGEPRDQHLSIEMPPANHGEVVPFSLGRGPVITPGVKTVPELVLAYPEDEMAEALLSVIARHKNPDEYGITNVLSGDPSDPARAMFLPSLARGGEPCAMEIAQFGRALDVLVSTGWLELVGNNSKTCLYRLSSIARGDRRFIDLVKEQHDSAG